MVSGKVSFLPVEAFQRWRYCTGKTLGTEGISSQLSSALGEGRRQRLEVLIIREACCFQIWTVKAKEVKRVDGCYTNLFRGVQNISVLSRSSLSLSYM